MIQFILILQLKSLGPFGKHILNIVRAHLQIGTGKTYLSDGLSGLSKSLVGSGSWLLGIAEVPTVSFIWVRTDYSGLLEA